MTDVDRALRKLEPLMPEAARRWRRARDLADPQTRALLERRILSVAHRTLGDIESVAYLSLPPMPVIKGDFSLGTVLYGKPKWDAGIKRSELLQNLVILGRSGAGKTNLVFHLLRQLADKEIPFLFLDWKRTARHMLPRLTCRARLFTPGRTLAPMPFNPFMAPPGIEPVVHAQQVTDAMADAYTLGDGARSLVQAAILSLSESPERRIDCDAVVQEVRDQASKRDDESKDGRARAWATTALRALETLRSSGLGEGSADAQARFARSLLDESTIVELDGLGHNARKFLVPLLCQWLYTMRLGATDRERLRLVVIVEEAHHLLHRGHSDSGESLMERLLRQCRELGIGMVVVDQHPHLLSSAALGNGFGTLCLNLKDPRDVNVAAKMLQLEDLDRESIGRLPVGQAIVKLQDRWRRPFLVRIPSVSVQKGSVSDAVLRAWIDSQARPAPNPSDVGVFGGVRRVRLDDRPLSEDELAFLHDVVSHPDDGVKARYRRLGMSGWRGDRTKRRLVASGWLESAVVPVGTSRKVVLRLAGRAITGEPERVGRESFLHHYWKHYYARQFRSMGWAIRLEVPDGLGQPDLIAEISDTRIGVEIETGSSKAVENVRHGILRGLARIYVVCVNRRALDQVVADLARSHLLIERRVLPMLAGAAMDLADLPKRI